MRITLRVVVMLLCVGTYLQCIAQEIQYDTLDAKYKLGAELWNIPISGVPTMSEDGSRVLIASRNDSSFYVIDVATGEYRKLNGIKFYGGSSSLTVYKTDPDLHILYAVGSMKDGSTDYTLFDIDEDSIIYSSLKEGHPELSVVSFPLCISKKYDVLLTSDCILHRATTLEEVSRLDVNKFYGSSWFDDDHGTIYTVKDRTVHEYNVTSGAVRSWGVANAKLAGRARRPKGQPWVYVATMNSYYDNSQPLSGDNMVYAINTETNERIEFTEYMGKSNRNSLWMSEGSYGDLWNAEPVLHICGMQDIDNKPVQLVWGFDAIQRRTQYDLKLEFYTADRRSFGKFLCFTPNSDKLIHTRNANGANNGVVCHAVVANNTSVASPPEIPANRWFRQQSSALVILQQPSVIHTVMITGVDGRVVYQQPYPAGQQNLSISTASFAAGAYVCTVVTEKERMCVLFIV